MRNRGFTMIELMCVIAIIAILASILFPLFARARETARRSTCASNLEQIGVALNMYAQNYNGLYPPKDNEFGPLYISMQDTDVFFCPSDSADREATWKFKTVNPPGALFPDPRRVPIETYSSYVYKGGLSNEDRADTVIAGESRAFHMELVNVLYVGGHVKSVLVDIYIPVVKPRPLPEPVGERGLPPPTGR